MRSYIYVLLSDNCEQIVLKNVPNKHEIITVTNALSPLSVLQKKMITSKPVLDKLFISIAQG